MSAAPEVCAASAAPAAVCTPHSVRTLTAPDARAAAAVFRVLADPLRLRLLAAIAADERGESCVCDLLELSDVSQSTVSHHLRVLRDAGLVCGERRGTWVFYRLSDPCPADIGALLAALAPRLRGCDD